MPFDPRAFFLTEIPDLIRALSARPEMIFVHLGADLFMAAAYLLLLVTLGYLLRIRRDLRFRPVFNLLGLFLLFAAAAHLVHLGTPWDAVYAVEGVLKAVAAVCALTAALFLGFLAPKAVTLPDPRKIRELNQRLNAQGLEHQRRMEGLLKSRQAEESALLKKNEELSRALETETSAKLAAEAHAKSLEIRSRALTGNAFDIITVLDPSGTIREQTPSAEKVLGYPVGHLTGRDVFDFISPEDTPRLRAYFQKAVRSGKTVSVPITFRLRHRDGSWRNLEAVAQNLPHEPAGTSLLVHSRDITEREQAENAARVLPDIMREISATGDFHTALEIALRRICLTMDWEYGEAWIPGPENKVLEASPAWYGSPRFKEFRELSRELRFPPKIGLPGHVWADKKPLWVSDIADSSLFRFQITQSADIQTALGVPVTADGQVFAVLIFFMMSSKPENPAHRDWILSVASYLGVVIQRRRAEESVRVAEEQLENHIQERTKALMAANRALQTEIADRRLSEEILRDSQENYLALLNSIDSIVWEFDLRTSKFSFISKQAERILGYPLQAWLDEPTFWQDHIHGGDREAATAFRSKVIADKTDGQSEYRMISSEGKSVWLRDMITVVVENQEAAKLRGAMVDITEQKQVAEALNQERNFASAVLDTAGALVMILDVEGRIVRFNRTCEKLSGYSVDDVRGKCFWDLFVVPDEVAKIRGIFARLLAGQFPTNYESHWSAKDSSRRVIAWTSTVLHKKDGEVAHIIATGIDVTSRKEAEKQLTQAVSDLARSNEELDKFSQELKEANERLKKLDEIKSHFISAASHELRTPLASLQGYVETILEGEVGPINEKQSEFLSYVKDSTDRLHRLLNELLDISKIESEQVEMNKDLTNLRDLLREEMMIFKAQANEKSIRLDMEMDERLKPLYCDADKIREVVDNLLSNAIKYTPRGGRVKIYSRNHSDGLQIDVQDTGIGIREKDLERVFEPFQHIEKDGIETEEESTGLGLTLVKKIVEAHGGRISVKSREGAGSTFTVILPDGSDPLPAKHPQWIAVHE